MSSVSFIIDEVEFSVLLGCNKASLNNQLLTFQEKAVVSKRLRLSSSEATPTWCDRKVMRLATLCTNRHRFCLPLHMTVRLTPAVDSVQV